MGGWAIDPGQAPQVMNLNMLLCKDDYEPLNRLSLRNASAFLKAWRTYRVRARITWAP